MWKAVPLTQYSTLSSLTKEKGVLLYMEDFVIISKEKEKDRIPLIKFDNFETLINEHLMQGRLFCIHGPSGCGKSGLIRTILSEYTFIDFGADVMRSKHHTENTLSFLEGTKSVILFDDIDTENQSFKIISDFINHTKYSTGPIVFICRECLKLERVFPDMLCLEMPVPTSEQLAKLSQQILDGECPPGLVYRGNLRNYVIALESFKNFNLVVSNGDDFYSTRESIVDLICKGGNGYQRFIGTGIEEHGHTQDLIFSNYKAQSLKDNVTIADSISQADVMDNHIYAGNWDFLPYFTLNACVVPSKVHGNTLDRTTLKPGSAWTKHYNYKMRKKQLANFIGRNPHGNFDIDSFSYLINIIKNSSLSRSLDLLKSYDIQSRDIDLMNHIVLSSRLKGKTLIHIKKALKKHYV